MKKLTRETIDLQLREAILKNNDLLFLRQFLVAYKELNFTQKEIIDRLEKMRIDNELESVDDRLLELLDIATGFCVTELRVW